VEVSWNFVILSYENEFLILWFFRFIERRKISLSVTSAVLDNDKQKYSFRT